jgi:hypothetical protein|uniref:Uncharacterized protein n=1 Tax=Picea glauca TaxID=3330 RepID=A0A101LUZ1_PICGL|nr:hypothetical protein ABT39_MTgene2175 [Picea glauca]
MKWGWYTYPPLNNMKNDERKRVRQRTLDQRERKAGIFNNLYKRLYLFSGITKAISNTIELRKK